MQVVAFVFFAAIYLSIRDRPPCGASVPTVIFGFLGYLMAKLCLNFSQIQALQRNRRENTIVFLLSVLCEIFLAGWMVYAVVEFFSKDYECEGLQYWPFLILIIYAFYVLTKVAVIVLALLIIIPLVFCYS